MNDKLPVDHLKPLSTLIVDQLIERFHLNPQALASFLDAQVLQRSQTSKADDELLSLKEAATLLNHSYCWLSRNYRKLGLRPSRVGGKVLFKGKDVQLLLNRNTIRSPGRPRLNRLDEVR